MTIYIVTYKTLGTEVFQVSSKVFTKRKDAEAEASEIRASGHTKVSVLKREVY